MRRYIFILIFIFQSGGVFSQNENYLYRVNDYPFIRYDLNKMHHLGNDPYSLRFFEKLDTLLRTGEGRVNIVQIGGSHIQAGTFSGQIRTRLQQLDGEMNAGWGFMFPYRIAHTNSPFGYFIRYSGYWQSCRNIEKRKNDLLGVGGISATTMSDKASLTILLEKENKLGYQFNKVRVMCNNTEANYSVTVDNSLILQKAEGDGFVEFQLNTWVDSLKISIQKTNNKPGRFTLYGLITESAPNGFLYHSIGVNGAHVPAFLRCQLFEKQLAQLKPDLVILGLGINDAYGRRFSQKRFEEHYSELIERIREAAPNTAIIFTTNNDSYLYRRYVNKNGTKVEESMFNLANKYQTGVWDMFEVMGGLNSIVLWHKYHLAQYDRIHFTHEGYSLLGDLFFSALMQDFENYTYRKEETTQLMQ